MKFKNIGTTIFYINLFIRTGWTITDPTRDTYWETQGWTAVPAGGYQEVHIDFEWAQVHDAEDDSNPNWQYPDGTLQNVHRLDEVTEIGFQITY